MLIASCKTHKRILTEVFISVKDANSHLNRYYGSIFAVMKKI